MKTTLWMIVAFMLITATCAIGQDQAPKPSPYQGLAKEITTAIADTAKLMSLTADEFVKTPLGQLFWWFLFWKLLGQKLFAILLGLPLWMTANYLLWKMYQNFFGLFPTVDRDGNTTYARKYEFTGEGAFATGIILTILAALVNIVGPIVVFG